MAKSIEEESKKKAKPLMEINIFDVHKYRFAWLNYKVKACQTKEI